MTLTNTLLLTQIAGYIFGLMLSLFCIILPLGFHESDFEGRCILFSEGKWNDTADKMEVDWASSAYCRYSLSVGVLMMIICFIQLYRNFVMWTEGRYCSFLSMFLESVGCVVLSGVVLTAAVFITIGFMKWCDQVSERFPSCQEVAGLPIDNIRGESTEWFYFQMNATQLGAWGAFTTLVGLAVASTLKLAHYHQVQNIHAVMASERAGERRPLLNSGFPEEGHTTPLQEE